MGHQFCGGGCEKPSWNSKKGWVNVIDCAQHTLLGLIVDGGGGDHAGHTSDVWLGTAVQLAEILET
jgi:hypothetical protein